MKVPKKYTNPKKNDTNDSISHVHLKPVVLKSTAPMTGPIVEPKEQEAWNSPEAISLILSSFYPVASSIASISSGRRGTYTKPINRP
jgi:hypothetical protein